jgi:hypothetical protein
VCVCVCIKHSYFKKDNLIDGLKSILKVNSEIYYLKSIVNFFLLL